jgi:hypothetical protein
MTPKLKPKPLENIDYSARIHESRSPFFRLKHNQAVYSTEITKNITKEAGLLHAKPPMRIYSSYGAGFSDSPEARNQACSQYKAVALMDKFKSLDLVAKNQEKKSGLAFGRCPRSSHGKTLAGGVSKMSNKDGLDEYYLEVIKAKLNFLGDCEV